MAKLANHGSDKSWTLAEAEAVLALFGFTLARQRGSHRTYLSDSYPFPIGLCPHGKGEIKPCYIQQIRNLLLK